MILSTNSGKLRRSCFSLKNGINAILYFMFSLSSSSADSNIFLEKAGHASCIVTTPNGIDDCYCAGKFDTYSGNLESIYKFPCNFRLLPSKQYPY